MSEVFGGKCSRGREALIARGSTGNARGLMPNYAAPLPAVTAATTWSRAWFGEDEDDVDRARSSAKCVRCR